MSKKIFFTGVTGFLGQFLAMKMLQNGWEIIFLVRPSKNVSVEDRVLQALQIVNENAQDYIDQYSVIAGDVTWKNFGIKDLCVLNDVDEFWHVAGAVTFSESGRDATFKINLDGAKNLLDLAEKTNVARVHYFGTAYTRRPGEISLIEESENSIDHDDGYNPYERSKNFAERRVHDWSIAHPETEVAIYRPSIVVGDAETGLVTGFTGLYRFLETFFVFGDKITGAINVPGKAEATVNLVTIDWVVDTVMKVQEQNYISGTYHLTNQNPPKYAWLLQKSLEILGVEGPVCGKGSIALEPQTKKLESLIRRGLRDYIPYISENVKFSQKCLEEILGKKFVKQPAIDEYMLKTLLDFAVEKNFGR